MSLNHRKCHFSSDQTMNKSVKHPQKRQGYVIQRLAESVRIRPSLTSQMTTFQ